MTGAKPEAAPAWAAIAKAAAIEPPQEGDTNAMVDNARTLLVAFGDAPIDKLVVEAKEAEDEARQAAEKTQKKADIATVVLPIPEGFVPRRVALGIGIGICVIALLISYFSVRAASMRRLGTLVLQQRRLADPAPGPPRGGDPPRRGAPATAVSRASSSAARSAASSPPRSSRPRPI